MQIHWAWLCKNQFIAQDRQKRNIVILKLDEFKDFICVKTMRIVWNIFEDNVVAFDDQRFATFIYKVQIIILIRLYILCKKYLINNYCWYKVLLYRKRW